MSGVSGAQLRLAAMNALARREHSKGELKEKIAARFKDCDELIEQILEQLAGEGLQSDIRFAESYSRARINRGYGRLQIAHNLKTKGVTEDVIRQVFDALEPDWFALASEVLVKRFGCTPAQDLRDKGRRVRFLQYRGFNGEQIRHALEEQARR